MAATPIATTQRTGKVSAAIATGGSNSETSGLVAPPLKNDALKAVIHERAVELGAEEVASIDILRWRAKGYFPSLVTDPVPGQVSLFPIPSSETSTNPLIK